MFRFDSIRPCGLLLLPQVIVDMMFGFGDQKCIGADQLEMYDSGLIDS